MIRYYIQIKKSNFKMSRPSHTYAGEPYKRSRPFKGSAMLGYGRKEAREEMPEKQPERGPKHLWKKCLSIIRSEKYREGNFGYLPMP